jgi:hypothetical protein
MVPHKTRPSSLVSEKVLQDFYVELAPFYLLQWHRIDWSCSHDPRENKHLTEPEEVSDRARGAYELSAVGRDFSAVTESLESMVFLC